MSTPANRLHSPPPGMAQEYFVNFIPHNREMGMVLVEHDIGRVVFDLPYQTRLIGDPETGVMHGGVITTLIDAVSGAAVLSKLDRLRRIATLDIRIDYLRPAKAGRTVRCEAVCYHMTQHIAFARATAWDGDPSDLVATAAGTFVVFEDGPTSLEEALAAAERPA